MPRIKFLATFSMKETRILIYSSGRLFTSCNRYINIRDRFMVTLQIFSMIGPDMFLISSAQRDHVWRKFTTLAIFWKHLGTWQNFKPTLANSYTIWANYWWKSLTIWSHCLYLNRSIHFWFLPTSSFDRFARFEKCFFCC